MPTSQELGSKVMEKAVVYADSIPAALRESGDVIHSKVELRNLISGGSRGGGGHNRHPPEIRLTMFLKSIF